VAIRQAPAGQLHLDGRFTQPQAVVGQRGSKLPFNDPRVLLTALSLFLTQPEGFRHANLGTWMARALGVSVDAHSPDA
jgi:hypothetical protein